MTDLNSPSDSNAGRPSFSSQAPKPETIQDDSAFARPEEVEEEVLLPEVAVHKRRFAVSMRFGLAVTILAAVLLTAAIVYIPWVWVSRQNIEDIVTELNKEIIKGVTQEIDAVFFHASGTLNTLTQLFNEDLVQLDNADDRKKLFLSMLFANPTFSWISLGQPNGDFIGAQRENRDSIRYHVSHWDAKRETAVREIDFYTVRNNKLNYDTTRTVEQDYYSPQRGWYRAAADSREIIWTPVYVFSVSKKPGLNTALAVEQDGKFDGVLSIAIELERISQYLQSLNVAKTGTVFLMTRDQQLIAFKDGEDVTQTVDGKSTPQLKPLSDAEDARLQLAASAIRANGLNTLEMSRQEQVTFTDPASGDKYFINLAPIQQRNWIAGTVIPESDFLEVINRNFRNTVSAVLGLILVTAIFAVMLSRWLIVGPLTKITDQTRHIQNFELDQIQYVPSVISEVDTLSYSMEQMRKGLGSFQKYLPTELVRTLISQGVEAKLGGSEKQVTIFFSDLVNFTHISEQMSTGELVPHLGDYLEEMSNVVTGESGTIDKYIGDSIMAFWGAPTPNRRHATDACRAALKSQRTLNGLRTRWTREGKPAFHARIGLNTGPVVVGNMGSRQKMNYTVIGDSVNVASRLEALNKLYGTTVLLGAETYEQAKGDIIARRVDRVAVYGKDIGMDIYELLAMRDDVRLVDNYDWIELYEEALEKFHGGQVRESILLFKKVLELRPSDPSATLFLKRCRTVIEKGLENSQPGMTVMRSK